MPASYPVRLMLRDDEPAAPGPSMNVAFATGGMTVVDQHFGSATRFAIYRVSGTGSELVGVTQFEEAVHDGNESKLPAKIAALQGCAAVFCQAVGGSAVRQLAAAGVQPIKVEPGALIAEALAHLRNEINLASTPWIVKALQSQDRRRDAGRFDAMEEEGWDG
ncbi:NifB/NifX family molybdenum-iron cluster-binding protein [Aquisphaera insulae]|uniref:NifB/NifX family molybdenum-iron cluster-binding protein n=1 Tax=Aquisphaera insulae TaxID=2712864 RepID=UPI00196A46BB|nr:NifB/NifX family molybdenum-iron cluster-binding protein [Aquisphaera insulae]